MNTQFKKGVMELCVLHQIHISDKYGYVIVTAISKYINVSENTIYPILHRLAKEKYLDSYLKESGDGPARKYYRITPLGQSKLKQMKEDWDIFTSQVKNLLEDDQNEK